MTLQTVLYSMLTYSPPSKPGVEFREGGEKYHFTRLCL